MKTEVPYQFWRNTALQYELSYDIDSKIKTDVLQIRNAFRQVASLGLFLTLIATSPATGLKHIQQVRDNIALPPCLWTAESARALALPVQNTASSPLCLGVFPRDGLMWVLFT